MDTKYVSNIYYPFLHSRGIVDLHTLAMHRRDMLAENASALTKFSLKTYRSVDVFHQIYYNRTSDIRYLSAGVKAFSIVVRHAYPHPISLDLLFKRMHADADAPFVVFSPPTSTRKETLTRMHSDRVSKSGRKIPALGAADVGRMSRDLPEPNQITASICTRDLGRALPRSDGADDRDMASGAGRSGATVLYLTVGITGDGSLCVKSSAAVAMSIDRWDALVVGAVKKFVDSANAILYPTGHRIPSFLGVGNTVNATVDIHYSASLSVAKDASLKHHIRCIGSVFSVADEKLSRASMRLRRVENFREMDELHAFVASAYNDPTHSPDAVVEEMTREFGVSREDAAAAYAAHLNNTQLVRAHAQDNPGFPVKFALSPIEKVLTIEVFGITHVAYLAPLAVYLDTVIRMTQAPDSSRMGSHAFSAECSATGRSSDKQDPSHRENVEAPMEATAVRRSAVAIASIDFLDADVAADEADEDDDSGGFAFDEYEDEYEDVADVPPPAPSVAAAATAKADDADIVIDGMSINDPSFFFKRIKERDPAIILSKKVGKYDAYARACPANAGRQPVVLSAAEKERIDREHPGSYNHALKHGSDPNNPNWYICPRFWCLKTGTSMTKDEVDTGVCGGIIPPGASKVPRGKYVYEFTSPDHVKPDGSYVEHTPGFLGKDAHPRFALPCCFSRDWASKFMATRRRDAGYEDAAFDAAAAEEGAGVGKQSRNAAYIISADIIPLQDRRWGFLPTCALKFLQTDYRAAVKNIHHIVEGKPCFLRFGVEQTSSNNQSFIGCVAEFYAHNQRLAEVPRVAEMRAILAKGVSLDAFIRYHNGSLAAVFMPAHVRAEDIDTTAYASSDFFKSLDLADETQLDFLENTVAAFENFGAFLRDPDAAIDHTYLWDIFASDNRAIMIGGANLVILNVPDDDLTDNIEMLCPTGAFSSTAFDPDRETYILLRQGEFYEPIYLYEDRSSKAVVQKSFGRQDVPNNISRVLDVVAKTAEKYCAPRASIPRSIYAFKQNVSADKLLDILVRSRATVHRQVMNYRAMVVSLVASFPPDLEITVPCLPSAALSEVPVIYMDDASPWRDYRTTVRLLRRVGEATANAARCEPRLKVVDDGMVVGVLTDTNQFVPVSPPAFLADTLGDDLPAFAGENYVLADKALARNAAPDVERTREVHKISLESGFYATFRTIARQRLGEFKNRAARKRVLDLSAHPTKSYREKLRGTIVELRALMAGRVEFRHIDAAALNALGEVAACPEECGAAGGESAYCLASPARGGSACIFAIPDRHMLTGADNDKTYYARLADELVRFHRTKLFMFNPRFYMNVASAQYSVNVDEILVLQNALTQTHFELGKAKSPYVKNTVRETAEPSVPPSDANEVSVGEQDDMARPRAGDSMGATEYENAYKENCVEQVRSIKGNRQTSLWVRAFPYAAKEIYFRPSAMCSFAPIVCIMQRASSEPASVASVKAVLAAEYAPLMRDHAAKISTILRLQGKRSMMARLERGAVDMSALIASDEYYVTDLDLWVFFHATKVPVIVFYSTKCKMVTNIDIDWLFLGGAHLGSINGRIHFIRSPANFDSDVPYSCSLVSAAYKYAEMGEFSSNVRVALSSVDEVAPNMQSLPAFLSQVVVVKRRGGGR